MREEKLNRETLQDKYEDSLFAVLMDEFAESEGQRLLEENEALKNDRSFQIPAGLEARSEKTISNAFAGKNRKEAGIKAKKIVSKAAIIVLVCGVLFTTLFSTVSAFRETVYDIFFNNEERNTDIGYIDAGEAKNIIEVPIGAYLPKWLPEGYVLSYYDLNTTKTSAVFSNSEGNEIKYYEFSNDYVLGVDTEDTNSSENIEINGFDGIIIVKGSTTSITWVNTKRNTIVRVSAIDIKKSTVIKIAESVK